VLARLRLAECLGGDARARARAAVADPGDTGCYLSNPPQSWVRTQGHRQQRGDDYKRGSDRVLAQTIAIS
jgi:hypothetical protein